MKMKRAAQNLAIFLLLISGTKNILFSFPQQLRLYNSLLLCFSRFDAKDIHIHMAHSILSFISGALMILFAYRLYSRVRWAWMIEVAALSISIALQAAKPHGIVYAFFIAEIAVFAVLLITYKDFSRKWDNITLKNALMMVFTLFFLIIFNYSAGLYSMGNEMHGTKTIVDSVLQSFRLLFLADTSQQGLTGQFAGNYAETLIALNSFFVISCAVIIAVPVIIAVTEPDYCLVRSLIHIHGQNPVSYLALENDKKYFIGKTVDGVAAYTVEGGVFVCCGDMVCDRSKGTAFLKEIKTFCRQNGWDIMFLNVTEHFLSEYRNMGFGSVKYGEDACFKLNEYNLSGRKAAKVRAAVNRAERDGITVHEYNPLEKRDRGLEREMLAVSGEWMQGKSSSESGFMPSCDGLENPIDGRCFYAKDKNGAVCGFVVYLPFQHSKSYLTNATRYKKNTPGVLEKLIYDSFMQMKDEGVEYISMGLSPLYSIKEHDRAVYTERMFAFIHDNLNNAYNLKTLHNSKEKYAPTEWQSRYVAFYPKPFAPRHAYAIVKTQNPSGISRLLLSRLKRDKPCVQLPRTNAFHPE